MENKKDRQADVIVNNSAVSNDDTRDLGFGSVVASESKERLLNKDGSFNVERSGLSFWSSLSLYHSLLTLSWVKFLSALTLFYLLINLFFAVLYSMCGPGALVGQDIHSSGGELLRAFFFSVQTFSTIGYGNVSPTGVLANWIVTAESLVGLLAVALVTGLIFARFSRPTANVIFSQRAVIAPYKGISAFMLRMSNGRRNQIIELEAQLLFAKFESVDGRFLRRFYQLNLERKKVVFFPLSWTVVHPIDKESPFYGLTPEDVANSKGEVLVLLTGIDETFSQTVHARSSYTAEEIVWNAKFSDIYNRSADSNLLTVNVRRLHNIEAADIDMVVPDSTPIPN